MNIRYLILGAGPTGLSIAHALLSYGVARDELIVLDRESTPGGLCRSQDVDGSPIDIGGGHFLDVRRKEVLSFLFRFLPRDEWNEYDRKATILINGKEIDHPLEANIWQLSIDEQVQYLEAIAESGSVCGLPMPETFVEWIYWKLGERIANNYMLPYNQKMWSLTLEQIGTYWLDKLPDVSFKDMLHSCLERRPFGILPAHGHFLYPKRYGYGEVWRRMGEALGKTLVLNCPVSRIDLNSLTVNGLWTADRIVNTIPWTEWLRTADIPPNISSAVNLLKYASIDIDYKAEHLQSKAHWIYEPRSDISYHRMLLRANFFRGAKGYWTETNVTRSGKEDGFRHRNKYAYPINTVSKPTAIKSVLEWARGFGIIGAGRWGTWEHMNSDVAVNEGMRVAKELI
ncbi:MAG: FAD-dependent oxidoreductase [Rectinemataceae bacterium]|jgi:protoporphyrinogen oxidase